MMRSACWPRTTADEADRSCAARILLSVLHQAPIPRSLFSRFLVSMLAMILSRGPYRRGASPQARPRNSFRFQKGQLDDNRSMAAGTVQSSSLSSRFRCGFPTEHAVFKLTRRIRNLPRVRGSTSYHDFR